MDEDFGGEAAPQFFKALNPVLKDKDYIITTDVGQHQMWAARTIKIQFARQWISSGRIGNGWALACRRLWAHSWPAPKAGVISISGDGGFKMTGSELFTIASYKIAGDGDSL